MRQTTSYSLRPRIQSDHDGVRGRLVSQTVARTNGCKNESEIWVAQTIENGTVYGSEYLDLYRNLDISKAGALAVWEPHKTEGRLVKGL